MKRRGERGDPERKWETTRFFSQVVVDVPLAPDKNSDLPSSGQNVVGGATTGVLNPTLTTEPLTSHPRTFPIAGQGWKPELKKDQGLRHCRVCVGQLIADGEINAFGDRKIRSSPNLSASPAQSLASRCAMSLMDFKGGRVQNDRDRKMQTWPRRKNRNPPSISRQQVGWHFRSPAGHLMMTCFSERSHS